MTCKIGIQTRAKIKELTIRRDQLRRDLFSTISEIKNLRNETKDLKVYRGFETSTEKRKILRNEILDALKTNPGGLSVPDICKLLGGELHRFSVYSEIYKMQAFEVIKSSRTGRYNSFIWTMAD